MKNSFNVALIIFGAALVAAAFNMMLVPHQLLSGGVSGISMLVSYFTEWNIGLLYFIFNLPILVWGLISIGRRFVVLSVISVIATSWLLQVIPENLVAQDPILGAVFGGVLLGLGTGISLRAGGSTGGFDIIGSIATRNHDFPLGTLLFVLNGFVVLALGELMNWNLALYSMLSIFISGRIVDMIHIRHIKVTAFIVTNQKEQLMQKLLKLPRGITVIKSEGAFTGKPHDLLMTVTTRYELAELKKIIREVDPKAFVNIVETVAVIGEFHRLK